MVQMAKAMIGEADTEQAFVMIRQGTIGVKKLLTLIATAMSKPVASPNHVVPPRDFCRGS
jgi:hypothetical protein